MLSKKHDYYNGECVEAEKIPNNPHKWDMRKICMVDDKWVYDIGFLTKRATRFWSMYPIISEKRYNICCDIFFGYKPIKEKLLEQEIEPYWWCRVGHWKPNWGILTQMHANLMHHIKYYWFLQKKKILEKITILPEVIIDEILSYTL